MAITFNLAPQPNWRFFYPATNVALAGQPLVGGKVYTYSSLNLSTPMATYTDDTGMTPMPNPIILNSNGEPTNGSGAFNPIYFMSNSAIANDNYYIEVYDINNTLIYTFDGVNGAPLAGTGSSTVSGITGMNYFRNPQFRLWSSGFITTSSDSTSIITADGWLYVNDVADNNDTISARNVPTTQTAGTNYYLSRQEMNIQVNTAGTSTYRGPAQQFQDVVTLSGQQVTISVFGFVLSPLTTLTCNVYCVQYFGSGGSPTVTTNLGTMTFNNSFGTVGSVTATIPSISGLTYDESLLYDDYMQIQFRFAGSQLFTVVVSETQLQLGAVYNPFQYHNYETDYAFMLPTTLGIQPGYISGPQILTSIPGWVLLNEETVGSASSNASGRANADTNNLFNFLWNNTSEWDCTIFNSGGNVIPKSTDASAAAAWTANRAIKLPPFASRVIGAAGQGYFYSICTASSSSGLLLTLTSIGANLTGIAYTGTIVIFVANGGTLPTGISAATNYYIIPESGSTFKIATSLANAQAGTAVAYTNAGSGNFLMQILYSSRSNLLAIGEEAHSQITAELAGHSHSFDGTNGDVGSGTVNAAAQSATVTTTVQATQMQTVGSNTAFNIIQPTVFYNYFIKL